MSLTVVENPITTSDFVNNVFAGFLPCEFKFKREDQAIATIGSGTDAKIEITITGVDLTSFLSASDSIYLYAPSSQAGSLRMTDD